jgi:hypothetical protein
LRRSQLSVNRNGMKKPALSVNKKRIGRPPVGSTLVGVRLPPDELAALDGWIANQKDEPTRPEAIRRLTERALARPGDADKVQLKVYRLNLTKERLAALPLAERRLLLLLGHASNEINVLSKLILMVGQWRPTIQMVDYVEAGQALILMRLLIGKLHEAWELFKVRFKADRKMATKYLPQLKSEATAAIEFLNKHFGKGSPLTKIRNQLAFHYKDEGDLIEANFNNLPATEPWEFYLSDIVANSFYYASELVVTGSLTGLAKGAEDDGDHGDGLSDQARAFTRIGDLTIGVSDNVTTLFNECIAAIVVANFSDAVELETIELSDVPRLTTITSPFFVDDSEFPHGGPSARRSGS